MDLSIINRILRFRIAIQTIKDYWKTTLIFTLLFAGMSAMYSGMYPSFKDALIEMMKSGAFDSFEQIFRGAQEMDTYIGFLNVEMYQIFFILILAILFAFIAASIISKEIESKTIDLLMSNPVSRKQIIIERFIGLIPMMLIINFASMLSIMGTTIAINESLDFYYLFLAHATAIPYFLAVIAISILISVIIDEKMKASIIMISLLIGMFVFETVSLISPDTENIGLISLTHYYNPLDTLKYGKIDGSGIAVLLGVMFFALIISIIYFDRKNIKV